MWNNTSHTMDFVMVTGSDNLSVWSQGHRQYWKVTGYGMLWGDHPLQSWGNHRLVCHRAVTGRSEAGHSRVPGWSQGSHMWPKGVRSMITDCDPVTAMSTTLMGATSLWLNHGHSYLDTPTRSIPSFGWLSTVRRL